MFRENAPVGRLCTNEMPPELRSASSEGCCGMLVQLQVMVSWASSGMVKRALRNAALDSDDPNMVTSGGRRVVPAAVAESFIGSSKSLRGQRLCRSLAPLEHRRMSLSDQMLGSPWGRV